MIIQRNVVDFSSNSLTSRNERSTNSMPSPSPSAWRAFQSGMQILQRYASSSPADIDAIAKSNLQLLHRSLSQNAQYVNEIENIMNDSSRNGLPALRCIYACQGFTADLLTLKTHTSLKLVAWPEHYTMYLLIVGSAQITANDINHRPAGHWWNYITSKGINQHLRNGTVIIPSINQPSRKITAFRKDCILLRVQMQLTTMSRKIAS